MRDGLRGAGYLALELAIVVALGAWYLGACTGLTQQLSEMAPGTRAFQLALTRTADSLPLALALGLFAIAILPLRRWFPSAVFAVVSALVLFLHWRYPVLLDVQAATVVAVTIAAFWAAVGARRLLPIAVLALAVSAGSMLPAYAVSSNLSAAGAPGAHPALASFTAVVEAMVLTGVGLAAAGLVRHSQALASRLEHSNTLLREQRAAVARAAVVDERIRIARELHDVIAHHVTAMTVHAGAARQLLSTNPAAANEPLRQIESSGRDAVAELHRLLGFLRGEGSAADRTPAPSLRDLPTLTGSFPSLRVSTSVTGDVDAVAPMLGLSTYRIVQEALTNVVKHSTASSAAVTITVSDAVVDIAVTDPGRPTLTGAGTGHGTLGLRERASLHGGTISVGPAPEGGWRVAALLPRSGRTP